MNSQNPAWAAPALTIEKADATPGSRAPYLDFAESAPFSIAEVLTNHCKKAGGEKRRGGVRTLRH